MRALEQDKVMLGVATGRSKVGQVQQVKVGGEVEATLRSKGSQAEDLRGSPPGEEEDVNHPAPHLKKGSLDPWQIFSSGGSL